MIEHNINKLNNFIAGWYMEDKSICDEIIDYFDNTPGKNPGSFFKHEKVIDKSIKDSNELFLTNNETLFQKYAPHLQSLIDKYIKLYPMCNEYRAWGLTEHINIQHYSPQGGYHAWHTERSSCTLPNAARHMVFMTYLNDVEDKGETEFFHQNLKVKPEKGLSLIWPADWTFTHRGIASPTQDKYIVTGWLNFTE